MRRYALPLAVTAVITALLATAPPAAAAVAAPSPAAVKAAAGHRMTQHSKHVCSTATSGNAACTARVRVDAQGNPAASTTPAGYGPADVRSAYHLTTSASGGRTVAIVDAYNDPTAESDLGVYRSTYGLPACTSANGCFRKVSQTGSTTNLPRTNAGWAQEISLDLDMVSATCPDCKILLVETSSASFANLGTGVNYAAGQPGVVAISNSYGGSDSTSTSAYDHPGIAVTASTGDSGYGVQSPASFPTVVAVGGTSLNKSSDTRGWTEIAWSGAGSGCSAVNAKPSWQTAVTQCSKKANADVSAVADPNTGVAVYDSTSSQGVKGWLVFGGTSVSSPLVASVYALSGNTGGYPASYTWAHASGLNDVTSGSNGSCSPALWCHGATGWDGPTGLGTPNGTSAF